MCALLEQRKQTRPDALEIRRGRNLDVVVVHHAPFGELDGEKVGAEDTRFAERPETGTRRALVVVLDRLERVDKRVQVGGRETRVNRWGTSEYPVSRGPRTWWPSASTSTASKSTTWTTTAGWVATRATSSRRATRTTAATAATGLPATTATVTATSRVVAHEELVVGLKNW